MIRFAVTVWVVALVGSAALLAAVVALQLLARTVRRATPGRPVHVPVPPAALDAARRVAV